MMIGPVALIGLLALAPVQVPGPGTGTVRGVVVSDRTGEPLPSTVIEIQGLSEPLVTLADSVGGYLLRGVPAGRRTLRATRFDHATFEVEVFIPAGRVVELDLALVFQPVELPAVIAQAGRLSVGVDTELDPATELSVTALRSLEATPGMVEFGFGEMMRVTPSPEPVDPTDVLYVRGAPSDLKLVYLDGAPVYSPFHLGGLISAFDPSTLHHASLYLGGAPARYDGGLSYVLDLETRSGRRDEFHSTAAVDLLSSNVLLEGPVGSNAGILAGWRTVHGQGSERVLADGLPYRYADLIGRLDIDALNEGRLSVTGFWNRESVRIGPDSRQIHEAMWGNGAASARYRGAIGESTVEVTASLGTYQTRLPFGGEARMVTEGLAQRGRIAADMSRPFGEGRLHYGASYDYVSLTYHAWADADAPFRSLLLKTVAAGVAGGAYADIGWRPMRNLRVRGGLRADLYSIDHGVRFAPRLSATLLLSDRAQLTLAAGRYRQFVRSGGPTPIEDAYFGRRTLYAHPPLALARASHLVITLDQELVEDVRLGIEGYYKEFDGMPFGGGPGPEGRGPEVPASPATMANATASGIDIWLRRARGELTGWLTYSLGWVWSASDQEGGANTFAGRHLLSAGLTGPLGHHGRISLRLAYGAGLPYSAIPAPLEPEPSTISAPGISAAVISRLLTDEDAPVLSGPPKEPYLRLDAEVAHDLEAKWRNRDFTITPYLRVLNALDRRDALFYHVNHDGGDARPVASLPFLPVIGIQWTF